MAESVSGANAPSTETFEGNETAAKLRDPSQPLTVRELFEAGVHFGHQTKRWNPKMRQYIYVAGSGIHIVDLDQTARWFKRAFNFVSETTARVVRLLFVGPTNQVQDKVNE